MAQEAPGPGEAFATWWIGTGELLPDVPSESAARTVWDVAIRMAVETLNREVDRLVHRSDYVQAAAVRDCRCLLERLFSTPGQWHHLEGLEASTTDWRLRWLRTLSTERIDAMLATRQPDEVVGLAARLVLIERRGPERPDKVDAAG